MWQGLALKRAQVFTLPLSRKSEHQFCGAFVARYPLFLLNKYQFRTLLFPGKCLRQRAGESTNKGAQPRGTIELLND